MRNRPRAVKRQYSGTLGTTGNCQVTVSLHAVGPAGTVPLGFKLYLPEEWCKGPGASTQGEDPRTASSFKPSQRSPASWLCARPDRSLRARRCWARHHARLG
ncbi:MAG: transposase [Solirubrobacteraceae bacterium]